MRGVRQGKVSGWQLESATVQMSGIKALRNMRMDGKDTPRSCFFLFPAAHLSVLMGEQSGSIVQRIAVYQRTGRLLNKRPSSHVQLVKSLFRACPRHLCIPLGSILPRSQ